MVNVFGILTQIKLIILSQYEFQAY